MSDSAFISHKLLVVVHERQNIYLLPSAEQALVHTRREY